MTNPLFRIWARDLRRYYESGFVQEIISGTQSRYLDLCHSPHAYRSRDLSKHLKMLIYPCLGLYQSLCQAGICNTRSIELVEELSLRILVPYQTGMKWFGKLPFFYELLRVLTPWGMKKNFPAEGWDTEWIELSNHTIAFNFHRCFYAMTLNSLGTPELTRVFCKMDYALYNDTSPHLDFERRNSLGTTGKPCDFRFRKVPRRIISNSRKEL